MPIDSYFRKRQAMRKRELDRLIDLLGNLSEEEWIDGDQRDDIGRLISTIDDRLEGSG